MEREIPQRGAFFKAGIAPHPEPDRAAGSGIELDEEEAARHLRLLDPDTDSFIFASFDDDKQRAKETARIAKEVDEGRLPRSELADRLLPEQRHGTLQQHREWMADRQRRGAGIFVTVQSMAGARRLKCEVTAIRAVFGEMDHGMPERWPLEPSFIIETSTGRCHPYWLVDPEHPIRGAEFTGIEMRLIETYGSDPDAKDTARVLRLAGTYNLKPARQPHLVKVINETGFRYARTELLAALPPPAARPFAALSSGPRPKFNSQMAPSLDRFVEPMKRIPTGSYGEWIKVGQALHYESSGAALGLRMWDAWSASSDKWYPGICEGKWQSFKGSGITGGTIYALAEQYGYQRAHHRGNGHTPPMGKTTKENVEAPPGAAPAGRSLISKRASDITPERVQWVWPGRIAVGKQTCVGGDPGTSKSTLSISIAAAVTKGAAWPCGEGKAPKGSVIILSAEDGAADTIIPRLLAAGADLDRVRIVTAVRTEDGTGRRSFNLQADLDLLEAHIKEIGDVVLIIIDPVSSYMGKGDSHKNTEVRQVLEPVGEMATRMRVAVVTITHFSKSGNATTTKALHRFIGSIAFIGAARAGFAVMEDPDDKGRRLFLHAKNNLAAPPQGLGYRLEERVAVPAKDDTDAIYASTIVWDDEPVGQTADDVLGAAAGDGAEPTAKDAVIQFLRELLCDGSTSVDAIERDARAAGLLREGQRVNESKPFRSAKEALGVITKREGFGPGARYLWSLPEQRDVEP